MPWQQLIVGKFYHAVHGAYAILLIYFLVRKLHLRDIEVVLLTFHSC